MESFGEPPRQGDLPERGGGVTKKTRAYCPPKSVAKVPCGTTGKYFL